MVWHYSESRRELDRRTTRRRDQLEQEPWQDHAPAGYRIFMQFFQGETREQALRRAAKIADTDDIQIAPGHFHCEPEYDEPKFQPYGWMTFVREDWPESCA